MINNVCCVNKMQELFCDVKQNILFNNNNKLPEFDNDKTCVENWVDWLVAHYPHIDNYKTFKDMLKPLIFKEYNNMLLVRYGNAYDYINENTTIDDFWNKYDGLYKECRSVVIDTNTSEVIMLPMNKFFNINELQETSYDNILNKLSIAKNNNLTIEYSDKLDGSMICARYYKGDYLLTSSQALNPDNSWRLQDAYTMLTDNYKKMLYDNPNQTFIFEYISLKDQHVVKYTKEQEGLYLIGERDVLTSYTYSYDWLKIMANKYNIKTTVLFNTDINYIMSHLNEKSSDQAEGFVINIDGYYVKLKYNDYVTMHKTLSSIVSPNYIIKAIADENFDDFISKVPSSYKENVQLIADKVFTYIKYKNEQINMNYLYIKNKMSINKKDFTNRKEFIQYINNYCNKDIFPYLICKYDNKEFDLLKSKNGKYIKMKQIDDFLEFIDDNNIE